MDKFLIIRSHISVTLTFGHSLFLSHINYINTLYKCLILIQK